MKLSRFELLFVRLILAVISGPKFRWCDAFSVATPNPSCRIFVGGLTTACSRESLRQSFERFGKVADVTIIDVNANGASEEPISKKKRIEPYAFVTFESADAAIEAVSTRVLMNQLFKHVKVAQPIDKSKRSRSNNSRDLENDRRAFIFKMCEETNLLIQVQSSHVDRMVEYIEKDLRKHVNMGGLTFHIKGSTRSVSKNVSLIFISSSDPSAFLDRLLNNSILQRAVKKFYIVDPGAIETDLSNTLTFSSAIHRTLDRREIHDDRTFRIHAFPPSRTEEILSVIDDLNREKKFERKLSLDPRFFSHVISHVEVYRYEGRRKETNTGRLVMSGISKSIYPAGFVERINSVNESESSINRAYYKLKEAIDRYARDHQDDRLMNLFGNSIALDVGSAPGGWTKFLAHNMQSKVVYSVDPGDLSINLPNIQHMKMKIQDAIPLLKDKQIKINIFVSDMCLHEMEQQLDFLLIARENEILEMNTFFVLTLKCNVGFSKDSFDGQIQRVVKKLMESAPTHGISVQHLFSNRNGERTIIGFIS